VFKTKKEPCIRVNIRELDRVPVTKCLPYIYLANGFCYTNLAYSKETCVLYTIDIWDDIIVLEPAVMFYILYDCVTVTCNVMLNPNPKFKDKKKLKNKIK